MQVALHQARTEVISPTVQTPGWPAELLPLFDAAITTEYASLTRRGTPLTYPLNPYISEDGCSLEVTTGLSYPSKAERARRNPKVALLFSDPVGTNMERPPVVLVQGMAAVRDADLQGNTDRYLRRSFKKFPLAYSGTPAFMLQRMPWYFARIWIQVTPLRMYWWQAGDLSRPPQTWQAPRETSIPASDPPPQGKSPGAWTEGPQDWHPGAAYAIQHLGDPVLTLVDEQGYPLPMRVRHAAQTAEGFHFELPTGYPWKLTGAACLTFHTHPEQFTGQQNMLFTGRVEQGGVFIVDKQVADWSMSGSKLNAMWDMMKKGRVLTPRLEQEARRRGQAVPKINLPKE